MRPRLVGTSTSQAWGRPLGWARPWQASAELDIIDTLTAIRASGKDFRPFYSWETEAQRSRGLN